MSEKNDNRTVKVALINLPMLLNCETGRENELKAERENENSGEGEKDFPNIIENSYNFSLNPKFSCQLHLWLEKLFYSFVTHLTTAYLAPPIRRPIFLL